MIKKLQKNYEKYGKQELFHFLFSLFSITPFKIIVERVRNFTVLTCQRPKPELVLMSALETTFADFSQITICS